MTKARPVENDVKAEIKKLLDEFGWHHWPGSAGPYSLGGVSDRLAVRGSPGKGCIFLAIEAKLEKDTGSKRQEGFLDDCRKQGAIGIVVNQARLPKLRQLLEAIDRALFPKPAVRYWHHPESGCVFTTPNGEPGNSEYGDGALVEEIDEAMYRDLIARNEAIDARTLVVLDVEPPTYGGKLHGDFGWSAFTQK